MAASSSLCHDDYTVGWICALPLEMAAAKLMLDAIHPGLPRLPTDQNAYILGNIGDHNIVIASLPSGAYGNVSAATVAMQLRSSFHSIRFGLMVGIGGGVPSSKADIRLGDIVVSQPTDTSGGVIQYDLGKALSDGRFQRIGMLNRPPTVLLSTLATLRAHHYTEDSRVLEIISEVRAKMTPRRAANFARPTKGDDLYQTGYEHGASDTCADCDRSKLITRPFRMYEGPVIHYGLIASANQVVKDSRRRDQLGRDLGVLCVEMEAAGLMHDFPCLVVRGICDYADSHKNKEWQGYAAVVAAAYAKELVSVAPIGQIKTTPIAQGTLSDPGRSDHTSTLDSVHRLGNLYSDQGKLKEAEEMYQRALAGYEKVLGPDNTSTLDVVYSFGLLYHTQEKLKEAEEIYQRALVGFEKACGPDHTSTLKVVGNLGKLYSDQEKLKEAEEMLERALAGYEKAHGPDHTSTLDLAHNLGNVYHAQGKLKEAEEMIQRALAGFEKAPIPDYASTLSAVGNLGNLYCTQGKLEEAEEMFQRALVGYEKAFGPDYTLTLMVIGQLGNLYYTQGKLEEAEEMFQRALAR